MTTHKPAARTTDPHTSHAAAASVKLPATVQTRLALLAILEEAGPSTDAELAELYDVLVIRNDAPRVSPSGLRTRRAELVDEGAVEDSGRRGRTPSGRACIVWQRVAS